MMTDRVLPVKKPYDTELDYFYISKKILEDLKLAKLKNKMPKKMEGEVKRLLTSFFTDKELNDIVWRLLVVSKVNNENKCSISP